MRVLVTGGRTYSNKDLVYSVLDSLLALPAVGADNLVIMNGGATGADSLSTSWAMFRRIPVFVFAAQWDRHGKEAGAIRNLRMAMELRTCRDKLGEECLVVGFKTPGKQNLGTNHMMSIAARENFRVIDVEATRDDFAKQEEEK
jgi:hypothetical protein